MNDYILDNELGDAADYPLASLGKRFANYVVDYVAALVTTMGIFLLIFVVSDSTGNAMLESDGGIMLNIVAIAAFLSYYIVFETFANGKTLGKLLTKTRAVKTDRSVMTVLAVVCQWRALTRGMAWRWLTVQ